MHVAICDDNVAERKQLERLMGREADKWIAKGDALYIFTYGSAESIMADQMQFDAIILDITDSEKYTTLSLVDKLRVLGKTSVMVISSKEEIDAGDREDIDFLPKPVSPNTLHEVITRVRERMDTYISKIELRGKYETLYVADSEIMHARQMGEITRVKLSDGRVIDVAGTAEKMYGFIEVSHKMFFMPNRKSLINCDYLMSNNPFSVKMKDGEKFSLELSAIGELREKQGVRK